MLTRAESVSYFPKDQNIKRWEIPPRTTLLSRLRQAPGELIADIPHFKHLPYVRGKYSYVTYHFLFFFHWFMCFALNKNRMKTQSYVTRYVAPPWNSSITFLVFYLCKQKCSSNQCRMNCLTSAVGISVNFSLTLPRYRYTPIAFFPSCFLKSRICVLVFFKFIQSSTGWNFLRQGSEFTKTEIFLSVPGIYWTPTMCYRLCTHSHSFSSSGQHCEINITSPILEKLSFWAGKFCA